MSYPQVTNNTAQVPQSSSKQLMYGESAQQGQYPALNQPPPPATIIIIETCPAFPHCNACGKNAATYLTYRNGGMTWAMSAIFCVVTGCCCFVPFMVRRWKDKQFRCANCHNIKGIERAKFC